MMETKQKYASPECEVLKLKTGRDVLLQVSRGQVNDTYDGNNDPGADVDW